MEEYEVADKIRKLREAKGLSQYALANLAGVAPTYISQLERGLRCPTVEYLHYICRYGLGISLADFFRDEKEQPADKIDELTIEQRRKLNKFLESLDI